MIGTIDTKMDVASSNPGAEAKSKIFERCPYIVGVTAMINVPMYQFFCKFTRQYSRQCSCYDFLSVPCTRLRLYHTGSVFSLSYHVLGALYRHAKKLSTHTTYR